MQSCGNSKLDTVEVIRYAEGMSASTFDPTADFYQTLGVDRDADSKTIKRAYRDQARKHHPDVNEDKTPEGKAAANAKMKEINEAYEVLGDEENRAKHDRMLWEREQAEYRQYQENEGRRPQQEKVREETRQEPQAKPAAERQETAAPRRDPTDSDQWQRYNYDEVRKTNQATWGSQPIGVPRFDQRLYGDFGLTQGHDELLTKYREMFGKRREGHATPVREFYSTLRNLGLSKEDPIQRQYIKALRDLVLMSMEGKLPAEGESTDDTTGEGARLSEVLERISWFTDLNLLHQVVQGMEGPGVPTEDDEGDGPDEWFQGFYREARQQAEQDATRRGQAVWQQMLREWRVEGNREVHPKMEGYFNPRHRS